QSLRTVRCLSNPSGMQAARWRDATNSPCGLSGACRIRAACRPRGGEMPQTVPADCPVPVESERHAGREVERCHKAVPADCPVQRHAGREVEQSDIEWFPRPGETGDATIQTRSVMNHQYDVLIIGSGLAGLTVALHLAADKKVAVLSKKALLDGSSNWAQGGIAAVLDSQDSHDEHIADTLVAGAGLCDTDATRHIVEQGRSAIDWLIELGVPFTP